MEGYKNISDYDQIILNYTGGTKSMTLGLYIYLTNYFKFFYKEENNDKAKCDMIFLDIDNDEMCISYENIKENPRLVKNVKLGRVIVKFEEVTDFFGTIDFKNDYDSESLLEKSVNNVLNDFVADNKLEVKYLVLKDRYRKVIKTVILYENRFYVLYILKKSSKTFKAKQKAFALINVSHKIGGVYTRSIFIYDSTDIQTAESIEQRTCSFDTDKTFITLSIHKEDDQCEIKKKLTEMFDNKTSKKNEKEEIRLKKILYQKNVDKHIKSNTIKEKNISNDKCYKKLVIFLIGGSIIPNYELIKCFIEQKDYSILLIYTNRTKKNYTNLVKTLPINKNLYSININDNQRNYYTINNFLNKIIVNDYKEVKFCYIGGTKPMTIGVVNFLINKYHRVELINKIEEKFVFYEVVCKQSQSIIRVKKESDNPIKTEQSINSIQSIFSLNGFEITYKTVRDLPEIENDNVEDTSYLREGHLFELYIFNIISNLNFDETMYNVKVHQFNETSEDTELDIIVRNKNKLYILSLTTTQKSNLIFNKINEVIFKTRQYGDIFSESIMISVYPLEKEHEKNLKEMNNYKKKNLLFLTKKSSGKANKPNKNDIDKKVKKYFKLI